MILLEDAIKYIGIIAVIYFLIKAFANDKMNNKEICLLTLFITVPIIAMCVQLSKKKCQIKRAEYYQITDPPIVPSIYPGPSNQDMVLGTVKVPPPLPESAQDLDVQDFKSLLPIDLEVYDGLIDEENAAKDRIRQAYTNEMVFTETNPLNTVPLGTQLYGYTFLPPENWFRAYERPPVCITDRISPVFPIGEGSKFADLLEFDSRSNISGPAPIDPRTIRQNINKAQLPQNKPQNVPQNTPYNGSSNVPANVSYNIPKNAQYNIPKNAPYNIPSNIPPNAPSK